MNQKWNIKTSASTLLMTLSLVLGISAPNSAIALEPLLTIPTPCQTGDGNACTLAFDSCGSFINRIRNDFKARRDQTLSVAENTSLLISWYRSTSFIPGEGLVGTNFGPTCDLRKPKSECAYANEDPQFQLSGDKITGAIYPGHGNSVIAGINGFSIEILQCYVDQLLDQAEKGFLPVKFPQCEAPARDIANLLDQNSKLESVFLSSIGEKVPNFCKTRLQANQTQDVTETCNEEEITPSGVSTNPQEDFLRVSMRIGACKLRQLALLIQHAFAQLVVCEAASLATVMFHELTVTNELHDYLKKKSDESPWGQQAEALGHAAENAATDVPPDFGAARSYGNQAAALITQNFGNSAWTWLLELADQDFAAPNCREPTGFFGTPPSSGAPTPSAPPTTVPAPGGQSASLNPLDSQTPSSNGLLAFLFGGFLVPIRRRRRVIGQTLTLALLILLSACSSDPPQMDMGACGALGCDSEHQDLGAGMIPDAQEAIADTLSNAGLVADELEELIGDADPHAIASAATAAPLGDDAQLPSAKPNQQDASENLPDTSPPSLAESASGPPPTSGNNLGGLPNLQVAATAEHAATVASLPAPASSGQAGIYTGGTPSSAKKKKPSSIFSPNTNTAGASSREIQFGTSGRNLATLNSNNNDPADYFARIDVLDSIFKVVEKRYRSTSMRWAVDRARSAAQNAVRNTGQNTSR